MPAAATLLPQWLKAAGHPVPAVLKVNAGLTYVGRLYRMPEDWDKVRWPADTAGGAWRGTALRARPSPFPAAG